MTSRSKMFCAQRDAHRVTEFRRNTPVNFLCIASSFHRGTPAGFSALNEDRSGSMLNHWFRFHIVSEPIENRLPALTLLLFRMCILSIEHFADRNCSFFGQELHKQFSAERAF